MEQKNLKKAFTMGETLITLSLIGILAITMLSLNNLSGNDTKIATAKLTQLDTALQAWGKAVTKSNETGLGATQTLTSQAALDNSLTDFLNTQGIIGNNAEISVNSKGYAGDTIKISKDLNLDVAFVGDKAALGSYSQDKQSSLALLTATASSGKVYVSNTYLMASDGLTNLDTEFEGWERYEVVPVGTVYMFCPGLDTCSAGCADSNSTGCIETSLTVQYIFAKSASVVACGSGQTGTIKKLTISDGVSEYDYDIDTCCPSPKVYSGLDENGKKLCSCPDSFVPDNGYERNNNSLTCQTPCQPGQFEENHECKLCTTEHYCPSYKMTAATECEAGYYCPNDKTEKDTTKYNENKYTKFDETNNTNDIEDGGLINKVKCPVGNYCPTTKLGAPTICPAGYYCPQEGLVQPIPCPAGTYGDELGATAKLADPEKNIIGCKPCPDGQYQDEVGQTSCKICANGAKPSADKTSCEICQAGTYFNATEGKCKPCPKGHKCPTAGMTSPTACTCGTYQPQEGKTECYDVPVGAYPTSNNTYVKSAATDATICPAGHLCAGGCHNSEACPCNQWAATGAATCTSCNDIQNDADGFYYSNPANGTDCTELTGTQKYADDEQCTVEDCGTNYKANNDHTACVCGLTVEGAPDGQYFDSNDCEYKECDTDKNFVVNEAKDGCECAPGYELKDGECKTDCPNYGKVFVFYATYTSGTTVASMCNANSNHYYRGATLSGDMAAVCQLISDTDKDKNVYNKYAVFAENGSLIAYNSSSLPSCNLKRPSSGICFTNMTRSSVQALGGAADVYTGGTMIKDGCEYSVGGYMYQNDPIILDLKGDGIKLTSAENGVRFDIDADGKIDQTAWTDVQTEFDNAFLCLDKNNNGKIDNGSELFGDQQGAATGLDELAKYDDNKDGVVDEKDAVYPKLLLWVDFNKNGVTDKGELRTLAEESIKEISTSYNVEKDENGNVKVDEYGNQVGIVGTFKKVLEDGTEMIGSLIDAFFNVIQDVVDAVVDFFTGLLE